MKPVINGAEPRAILLRLSSIVALLAASSSAAESWLDRVRDTDLNDYAVGVAVTARQMPYAGAGSSATVYPYLTAIKDSALTDDALMIRDGAIGLRTITESQFQFALLAHLETLGFGADAAPELDAFVPPEWTLELGPSVGWRGWVVQPDLTVMKGVLGGHSGLATQLSLSLPVSLERGYVVPYLSAIRQNQDYVDYYYGVGPAPTAGAYDPGDATNFRAGIRFGYRLSDLWVVTGNVSMDWLDDSITDSPLVVEDRLPAASLGLAYNRSVFRKNNPDKLQLADPTRFALSLFAVDASVDSDLRLGPRASRVDLENGFGFDTDTTVGRAEAVVRIGRYHRLELGYLQLTRSSSGTLQQDVVLGDVRFNAGDRISARLETEYPRIAYGYSVIRDDQKELGFTGGVRWTRFDAMVSSDAGAALSRSVARSPFPTLGAYADFALRGGFAARARVEAFGLEFDRYDGSMVDFQLGLEWQATDWLAVEVGYSSQRSRLAALAREFVGSIEQHLSGPYAGVTIGL